MLIIHFHNVSCVLCYRLLECSRICWFAYYRITVFSRVCFFVCILWTSRVFSRLFCLCIIDLSCFPVEFWAVGLRIARFTRKLTLVSCRAVHTVLLRRMLIMHLHCVSYVSYYRLLVFSRICWSAYYRCLCKKCDSGDVGSASYACLQWFVHLIL